jgi:hypothetical protein
MSFVRRAAWEHFWQSLANKRKPLAQKHIEPIRNRLVSALESNSSIIVEKVHFTSHANALVEVTCTWVGMDAHEEAATAAVKGLWTPEILDANEEMLTFDPQEDLFYVLFAGEIGDSGYLTGRILIRL